MKPIITLLICVLIGNIPSLAQSINRLSAQAGYLYSTHTLTPTTYLIDGLPDSDFKPGFYVGLTYEHQLSTLLTSGLNLSYQQKGDIGGSAYIKPRTINTYHYLGVTPMIGIRPIQNLRFLIGPQLNFLVNKSTSNLRTYRLINVNHTLEFGLLGRISYELNRVGLSASYFKGLTAYYTTDSYYSTNQTWQLGLFYQLNKNKSH